MPWIELIEPPKKPASSAFWASVRVDVGEEMAEEMDDLTWVLRTAES